MPAIMSGTMRAISPKPALRGFSSPSRRPFAKSTIANTASAKGSGTKNVASGMVTSAEPNPVRPWINPAAKAIGARARAAAAPSRIIRRARLGEGAGQHPRDVNGLSRRAIGDLMATAGAVGDEERVLARGPDLGKQSELSHSHRDRVVPGLVAEAAGHAAAGGLDRLDLELRSERQRPLHSGHRAESLLVAVAVQERALFGERLELEREAAGFVLEREELLEEQRLRGERVGLAAREHRLEFVAQGQEAGRLEADDIDSAPHVGLERVQHATRLGLRLVYHAGREKGAAAAQRPRAVSGAGDVHSVAGAVEHG